MNNLDFFENNGITFINISKTNAENLVQTDYSLDTLSDYCLLFDQYQKGPKTGQFINLDFSQLTLLADMDFQFSILLLEACLSIEHTLKIRLKNYFTENKNFYRLYEEYFYTNIDYIKKNYTADNNEIVCEHFQNDFSRIPDFKVFVDMLHFGTLVNFIFFVYPKCEFLIFQNKINLEWTLNDTKWIRNNVAHGNAILNRINEYKNARNYQLVCYLGKRGIKHRTLITNMSKNVIGKICNLLFLYFHLVKNNNCFKSKILNYYNQYKRPFLHELSSNNKLMSIGLFLKEVFLIFFKDFT